MEVMRRSNCSFEVNEASNLEVQGGLQAAEAEAGRGPGQRWARSAGIPTCSECFRCLFRCGVVSTELPTGAKAGGVSRCSYDSLRSMHVRRGLYAYQLEIWSSSSRSR